jgi:hypothetical protein
MMNLCADESRLMMDMKPSSVQPRLMVDMKPSSVQLRLMVDMKQSSAHLTTSFFSLSRVGQTSSDHQLRIRVTIFRGTVLVGCGSFDYILEQLSSNSMSPSERLRGATNRVVKPKPYSQRSLSCFSDPIELKNPRVSSPSI